MTALVSLAVLLASSCSTTSSVNGQNGVEMNDAQLLEQHDDYVPWWKFNF